MRRSWVLLLLGLLGAAVYSNALSGAFLGDDSTLIVQNPLVKNWRFIPQIFISSYEGQGVYWRPLAIFSHALEYPVWGLNPLGYHLTNSVLHVANSFLIYLLVSRLFGRPSWAFITSLLFLVHPIQTEEVTYISGRCGLLAAFFMLAGLILYVEFRRGRGREYYLASIIFFLLGLLSKESAVVFPLAVVFLDAVWLKARGAGLLRRIAPFMAILAAYFLWRGVLGVATANLSAVLPGLLPRLVTMAQVVFMWWGLLGVPAGLVLDRTTPLAAPLRLLDVSLFTLFLLLVGGSIYFGRRSRLVPFAMCWFFIFLAPVLQIIPVTVQGALFTPEHFLYLPSAGFFLLLGSGLALSYRGSRGRKIACGALVFALVVSYAAVTVRRNVDWRDPRTLYSLTVRQSPQSARAHVHLGLAQQARGDSEGAAQSFQEALRLKPDYVLAHNNLGIALVHMGKDEDALAAFGEALRWNAGAAEPHNNIGYLMSKRGEWELALKSYENAIHAEPYGVSAHNNLGTLFFKQGDVVRAEAEWERAVTLDPDYLPARENLARLRSGGM